MSSKSIRKPFTNSGKRNGTTCCFFSLATLLFCQTLFCKIYLHPSDFLLFRKYSCSYPGKRRTDEIFHPASVSIAPLHLAGTGRQTDFAARYSNQNQSAFQ